MSEEYLFCNIHTFNLLHIYCDECNIMLCDLCEMSENHNKHQKTDSLLFVERNSALNIMSSMMQKLETKLYFENSNKFDNHLNSIIDFIENQSKNERFRLNSSTSIIFDLIKQLNTLYNSLLDTNIKRLKEEIAKVAEYYSNLKFDLQSLNSIIEKVNRLEDKDIRVSNMVREFLQKKAGIERFIDTINIFSHINKNSLYSEFTIEEYLSNLTQFSKLLYDKQQIMNRSVSNTITLEKKINISFYSTENQGSSKGRPNPKSLVIPHNFLRGFLDKELYKEESITGSINFVPFYSKYIYYPIDRTNSMIRFDIESRTKEKFKLNFENFKDFRFLPYFRYVNSNGRIYFSGGFEGNTLSSSLCEILDLNCILDYKFEGVDSNQVNNANNSNDNDESESQEDSQVIRVEAKKVTERNKIALKALYSNPIKNSGADNTDKSSKDASSKKMKLSSKQVRYQINKLVNMKTARAGHSMVGIGNKIIFIIGGIRNNNSSEVYNIETNTISEFDSLNLARIDPLLLVTNNKLFVFWGLSYDTTAKSFAYISSIEYICLNKSYNQDMHSKINRKTLWELVHIEDLKGGTSKFILIML